MKNKQLQQLLRQYAEDVDVCILPYRCDNFIDDVKNIEHICMMSVDGNVGALILVPYDETYMIL